MKKVICDHAGESDVWCNPKWCGHSVPHRKRKGCVPDECSFVGKIVRCVEVEDEKG